MSNQIVLSINPKEGINPSHRRENGFMESYLLQVIYKGGLLNIANCRIYGTKAMNYCCLWITDNNKKIWASGSGSASGFGYHRPSAAAQEAFKNSGVELSEPIQGRGDRAIEQALFALAKKMGYRKIHVTKAHG